MAHLNQEVPRDAWRSYFDDLSRRLGTVEATLEVDGPGIGAQIEAEHLTLKGVTYDSGDDIFVVGLDAPDGDPEELERVIDHPPAHLRRGRVPRGGLGDRDRRCRGEPHDRHPRASAGAAVRGRLTVSTRSHAEAGVVERVLAGPDLDIFEGTVVQAVPLPGRHL